jgi:hypothetical protein
MFFQAGFLTGSYEMRPESASPVSLRIFIFDEDSWGRLPENWPKRVSVNR